MRRYTLGPNRYLCSVLDELRDLDKLKNYSSMASLIEEVQVLGNRMEAALEDAKDLEYVYETKKKLEKEIKDLEKKKEDLSPDSSEEV